MGEYAKYNGREIKIGTCESMYYLRWDDRRRVTPMSGSVNPASTPGLFFRLPFPDEDDIGPGGRYEDYRRGYQLGSKGSGHWNWWEPSEDHATGSLHMHHDKSGLSLNIPCHHGMKLPNLGEDVRAHWNGKGHAFELIHVKSTRDGLRPVYWCRFCECMWSADWAEILPYCGLDAEMLRRLKQYANTAPLAVV